MSTLSTARRVFISHSHQDNELVRDIARRLRDAGFETSVDFEHIASGAEFRKHVRERLSQSSVILILVTPASLRSPWIMTELGMAEGLDRQVLPVTVGVSNRDLPEPLKTVKTVPFDRLDQAIRKLSAQSVEDSDE
jgi:hypothetical protein